MSDTLIEGFLTGYKVEKWIFRGVIIFLILLLLFDLQLNGWSFKPKLSVYCKDSNHCENPLNNISVVNGVIVPSWLKEMNYVPAGFVYDERTWIEKNFQDLVFLSVLFAFLLNHFLFNRGYPFRKVFSEKIKRINEQEEKGK